MKFSTDQLTAWLIAYLVDKHSSITVNSTGLIFSQFDVTSVCKMCLLVSISQYAQCILHGLTSVPLCAAFILADSKGFATPLKYCWNLKIWESEIWRSVIKIRPYIFNAYFHLFSFFVYQVSKLSCGFSPLAIRNLYSLKVLTLKLFLVLKSCETLCWFCLFLSIYCFPFFQVA